MAERLRTLVIAGASKWKRTFFKNDVRIGWRITCQNGEPYDMEALRDQVMTLQVGAKSAPELSARVAGGGEPPP